MKPEAVGYRYSRAELSALMRMMGISAYPGFTPDAPNEAAHNAAIASLAESGLATAGDTVYVDRITALILSAMHRRTGSIAITAQNRNLALIRSEIMYILADFPQLGACTLTPLERAKDIAAPLHAAMNRLSYPILIELSRAGQPARSEQAASAADFEPLLADCVAALCAEAPTER